MEPEQQNITIQGDEGFPSLTLPAFVYGHLAYHPTPGKRQRWTVTHIPTGCCLKSDLASEEQAKAVLAAALQSKLDWSQTDLAYFQRVYRNRLGAQYRTLVSKAIWGTEAKQ